MVSERLGQYIEHKKLSYYAFENSIKASRGSISKSVKESKSIGSTVLENILSVYIDLNPTWLLTGNGPMLLNDSGESTPRSSPQSLASEPEATSRKGVSLEEYNKLKNEYDGYRRAMQDVLATESPSIDPPPGKIYENSIQHRFCQLIDEIKEYELFENDTQVAKRIRVKPRILADYKAGRRNFTIEFLTKVLSSFDFIDANTLNWLFTGKGEILTDRKVDLSIKVVKDTEIDTDDPKTTP